MTRGVLKNRAVELRKQGKSYQQICAILDSKIPKSTMAAWFKNIPIPMEYIRETKLNNLNHLRRIRQLAINLKKQRRDKYLKDLLLRNLFLLGMLDDFRVAKIALAMLYLGEGGKSGSRLVFGNANPKVIGLFLKLLHKCYKIDISKFRVTVQCRGDQDISNLEAFWHKVTNVPLIQFYKTRIDPRTIGIKTLKSEYKGVCRIDYFSSFVFDDIMQTINVVFMGP